MKNRLVFIAYVLGDIEDLVHFYPQYFHSNTFKLQFDQEDTPPPSPSLSYSIMNKNKPIYFTNEVYAE